MFWILQQKKFFYFSYFNYQSSSERRNRKYTRTRIVNRYLDGISIAQGLLPLQSNNSEVDRLLKAMYKCFDDIMRRAELQAHLLHADEIDKLGLEKHAIRFNFGEIILRTSGNLQLSQDLYDFLRNNLSSYIVKYKLKEFNEYVVD